MFPRFASLVLPLIGIAILSIPLTTPGAAAEHGYLGMVLQRLENGKLRVLSVQAGGPAERAGIRPGDLVLRIDGREARAKTDRDIVELVRPIEAGQAVKIELSREGEPLELLVEAAPRPQEVRDQHRAVLDGTRAESPEDRGLEELLRLIERHDTLTVVARDDGRLELLPAERPEKRRPVSPDLESALRLLYPLGAALERLEPGEAVTARIRLDEKTNRLVVELRDR